MNQGTLLKKACEARLRALVPEDVPIEAVGTAEELRSLGPDIGSGSGWTFIVLTSERLLFAPWGSPDRPHEEISLDTVTRWASGTQYNCEALVLTHNPMTRKQRVAAHRFLSFEWGRTVADVTRTETVFRFSRPETRLAKALHSAMTERAVPHTHLHFEERSREERTRGSQIVMHARND